MHIGISLKSSQWALGILMLSVVASATWASTPPQIDPAHTSSQEVLAASAVPTPASNPPAAPAPLPSAPQTGSSYRWTGFYVGVNGGYTAGRADTSFIPLPGGAAFINLAPVTFNADPRGAIGGLQTGYNWESGDGAIVLGVEADFSATNASRTAVRTPIIQNDGTPFPGPTTGGNQLMAHQSTNWIATLRPRFGTTPLPRWFVYATGGLALGHVSDSGDSDFRPAGTEHYPISIHRTKAGWAAGAGSEVALGQRWSFKTEYLYYNLGSEAATANPSIPFSPGLPNFQIFYKWQSAGHIARAGLNFRF